jgi:8-oxo-dGTP pyrophosphatase MutT (NUDIX family)
VKETVQSSDGQVIEDYYIASKGDVAMALPITVHNEVVVIREYRHGAKDYVWQLPAGYVEQGETPLEAAKRELLQETGYEAPSWELLGSWYISSPRMPDKQFVFIARAAHKVQEPELEDTEEITMKLIGIEEAIGMVLNNEIGDPHSCTAILWAERLREK